MSRIVVFSDSHGSNNDTVIREEVDRADYVIFLGDGINKLEDMRLSYPSKVLMVCGNCDLSDNVPKEMLVDIDGVKLLITHGHLYNVKCGDECIISHAKKVGAGCILYGHTHRAQIETKDEIFMLNPGSLRGSYYSNGTYAVLEINNGNIFAKIIKLA